MADKSAERVLKGVAVVPEYDKLAHCLAGPGLLPVHGRQT